MAKLSSSNGKKANVPKLRFPEFTEEWKASNIGEISTYIKGAPLSKSDISETGTPFILYGELYTTYKEVATEIKRKTNCIVDKKYFSKIGDVVIPTSGETPEEIATATCVMTPNVILAGDLNIFRINDIDGRFFSYVINHKVNKDISRIAQGKSIVHIKGEEISKIQIKYPSAEEQQKILSFIELLSLKIEKQERLIEKLKKYKRGALSALFPKKGEITPQYRFAGFTKPWEQRKLGNVVQVERGGSPRPIDDYITDSQNGLNWVKIGDAPAQGHYITKTAEKIKPEGLSKTREVHPGDLILSNSMSFGKPYIMGIDGCIHDGWLLIRDINNTFDLTFLCHLLGTPQMLDQYRSLASGSTVNNLNKELVGNTVVTIPKIDEQRVLGQYLERLDNLITLHQRELTYFFRRILC